MNRGYAGPRRGIQWVIGWVLAAALAALAAFPAFVAAQARPAAAAPAAQPKAARTILVMGDSLSAAYGIAASQGWVALTADRIAKSNPGWRVVNASISGETTAGGRARIDAQLRRVKPSIVIIELGANDGLRGLPLAQTRANLDAMVRAAKASGARVLLLGMTLPPNYGRAYVSGFEENFRAVAKAHGATLVPFFLEPIARDPNAFQADRLHPTAAVQPKLRDHVWPTLAPMLR